MSDLARALVEAIRDLPPVTTYDVAAHARMIRALVEVDLALVDVVVAQGERIERLEERVGETLGMGG